MGSTSIKKFEMGTALRPLLLHALRASLEAAGIGFIEDGSYVADERAAFGVFVKADWATAGQGDALAL